jgi:hypothetical protein
MKANELRVDNWCQSPYEKEPFKIKAEHILQLEQGMDELSILGIPLTPEILIKAGFEEMEFSIFESNKYDIYLYYSKKANGFLFKSRPDGGIILKHLHQLQNLYFALTGEELNIQL